MNRETKRLLQRQGQLGPDGAPTAGGNRPPPGSGRGAPPGAGGAGRAGGAGTGVLDRPSRLKRIGEYLREVRNELVKVAWPGRAEVVKYTIVVFFTVVVLTAIVFGLDALFARLVLVLFGH